MANFATLRGPHTPSFTGGIGREVVVVDVALVVNRRERIDLLFHFQHIQGGHTKDLGFATLEQRGTVGTWNEVYLHPKVADVGDAAAVDTEVISEDAAANNGLHQGIVSGADVFLLLFKAGGQVLNDRVHVLVGGLIALLLIFDGQQLLELLRCFLLHCGINVVSVGREQWEFLRFFRGLFGKAHLCTTQNFNKRLRRFQALSHNAFRGAGRAVFDAFYHL